MERVWRPLLTIMAVALAAMAGAAPSAAAGPSSAAVPRYDHVFVVVEENHGFADVIGNPAAPNLNALARQFGLATSYFGVSHPSEPNYVALVGGSTFGVADDNPYWINAVNGPSLVTQLDQAGIGWKAYLQGVPHPGYLGNCFPSRCNGSPDVDPLYVSKHNGIMNFTTSHNPDDLGRQVPIEQLAGDLSSGSVPRVSWVIPTECHDQHGDPPYCIDSGNPGDPQDQHLVAFGDRFLGKLVSRITGASFWAKGNNAVVITYDEGDDNAGCCDAGNGDPNGTGGGRVATVVVTNHGPRGLQDPAPYNHFSLLQTIQDSFGLGCLQFTCDTANVKPLAPLFAVTGSAAVATKALAVPAVATPSPTPTEPTSLTTKTPSSGGWQVVASPLRGTGDNSLGGVAGSGPNDVWAVGNYLPDTATSNQDATLSLANHFDGANWTLVPTPNSGPNFNTLFGVAAAGGRAWAVGVNLDANFQTRSLIEAWNGSGWSIVGHPQPGARRDLLWGASALTTSDVWAVGAQVGANGRFETLIEHFDGQRWSVVPSPNPGRSGNNLYAVSAVEADDVWAVGQQNGASGPDQALIEHWDGTRWSVVPSPTHGGASAALYGVAGRDDGRVVAVGQTTDVVNGARPLVEELEHGTWRNVDLPAAGSNFTDLWGVTLSGTAATVVGTFLDGASGNNETLILRGDAKGFTVVNGPNPGSGSNILAGVAAIGDTVWAVGHYDDGGGRLTLIERHREP